MKNWKDVYELPLKKDFPPSWIYDSKGNFVFQFISFDENLQDKVLQVINGERKVSGKTSEFIYEKGFIQAKDTGAKLILIRGWGGLTGSGGLNLSGEEASNIQNTFAEFIISKFKTE